MKTAEQLTADVLARRDAYLAARDKRRKAAKKYAAAGLCVCAAALAAAGLYRSGLLNGDPLSPDDITEASRPAVISGTTVSANDPTSGSAEERTGAREPTGAPSADNTTEPSSVGGNRPDKNSTTALTEEPGTAPARQAEPATGRTDDFVRERPWTSAEQTEEQDVPTEINGNPTAAAPTTSPVEIGPSGGNYPGTTPTTTEKDEGKTAEPTTEPFIPEEAPTQNGSPRRNESATYIIYNGGLYAVGDGMTVPIPEEAEVVGRQTVIVLRDDEAVPTEAIILSCPSEPQEVRTAVAAENENEMCLMEYLGTVEELLREETP